MSDSTFLRPIRYFRSDSTFSPTGGIEITLAQYELVTQGKLEYEWTCHLCSEPAPKRQRTRSPTPSLPRQRTPTPPRLLNVTITIDVGFTGAKVCGENCKN